MKGAVLPLLNHKMSIQLPQCNSAVRAHIESRPNALNTRLIVAMVMLLLRSSFEIWDFFTPIRSPNCSWVRFCLFNELVKRVVVVPKTIACAEVDACDMDSMR